MGDLPKKSSASSFSKDNWGVWRNLEITVSFLDPVLLLPVDCEHRSIKLMRLGVHLKIPGGSSCLTVVHLVLLLVHGVNSSSGPELQQSLKQKASQVHCEG